MVRDLTLIGHIALHGADRDRLARLHGHYYAMEYRFAFYRQISPLYRAELFTGELPENCSFMKRLSEKIHADPGYGDKVDEVLCDLKL